MNKICTSIEQSKKLIELGIDADTSDMVYLKSYFLDEEEGQYNLLVGSYHEGYAEKDDGTLIPIFDEHIPAWSLSALLELIPERIPGTKLVIKWDGSYYIEGRDCLFDNAVDAAFEMVVWLKENKKL